MAGRIVEAVLISALLLWVEHWFPWRLALKKDLPRLAAYAMGVLALVGPLTWLFVFWARYGFYIETGFEYVVALWAVVIGGGVAVGGAYLVDWVLARMAEVGELREVLEVLNEGRETEKGVLGEARPH